MENVDLASVDGIRLDAILHRPARGQAWGSVVGLHGITGDLDARGKFIRLGEQLVDAGLAMLRFSFRGHGKSGGTQRGTTIAGECLDLHAAVEYMLIRNDGPLSIVATSFGAVTASLSLRYLKDVLHNVVLWCPVLDLRGTFLEPGLPWGKRNFGAAQQARLHQEGHLLIDDNFALGRVMWDEFRHYRPLERFIDSEIPALIIHGDLDDHVSYNVAKNAALARRNCDFHTIASADHGFDSTEMMDEAIRTTLDWLIAQNRRAGATSPQPATLRISRRSAR